MVQRIGNCEIIAKVIAHPLVRICLSTSIHYEPEVNSSHKRVSSGSIIVEVYTPGESTLNIATHSVTPTAANQIYVFKFHRKAYM